MKNEKENWRSTDGTLIQIYIPFVKCRLRIVHLGVMVPSGTQSTKRGANLQAAGRSSVVNQRTEKVMIISMQTGKLPVCTGYRRLSTYPAIMRGSEWINLDFGRIFDRLNVRQPIVEMSVMTGEPTVGTRVRLQGYRTLPRTRISL
ncbi:hypothetical protein HAX54_012159, partial [Datura stramonium]|nr:hypothetical protein [Datura stramonium]